MFYYSFPLPLDTPHYILLDYQKERNAKELAILEKEKERNAKELGILVK